MSIEEKDKIPNLVCRPVVLYISSFRLSWKPLSRTAFGGISTAANCKVVLHLQTDVYGSSFCIVVDFRVCVCRLSTFRRFSASVAHSSTIN